MSVTDEAKAAAKARLVLADGTVQAGPGMSDLDAALSGPDPFWLDLPGLDEDQADWLGSALGVHPLIIEDAQQFSELPKIDVFDDYIAVVLYGTGPDTHLAEFMPPGSKDAPVDVSSLDALAEVHCIVSERYIVTVHRDDSPALADTARLTAVRAAVANGPAAVFYGIADALTDSFFPVLDELDDRLDVLQAQVISNPRDNLLTELGTYRMMLIPLHKVLLPQADIFASLSSGKVRVPAGGDDQLPYLRDISDHLRKLSGQVDSYRDLIAGAASSYVSVVSNQQNTVMKQLAVISTIFLPLSFLTGFFGQNFGALINHITTWSEFLIVGIGSEAVAVALLCLLFWRRGWLKP